MQAPATLPVEKDVSVVYLSLWGKPQWRRHTGLRFKDVVFSPIGCNVKKNFFVFNINFV